MGAPLTGAAFAPAAISNFFAVHRRPGASQSVEELRDQGATGGGYMLSAGVLTRASVTVGGAPSDRIGITVNGDAAYLATTTRTAVRLMLDAIGGPPCAVELDQAVGVRIGCGFGASAASALSAVMSVGAAVSTSLDADSVASFAHAAEILCMTGLGTVSAISGHGGAGVIVKPGGPGVARVLAVPVPGAVRVVTASLAPVGKEVLLSSPAMRERVNRLGAESLRIATSEMTLESLARAGEAFSEGLGIASPQVRRLAALAREAGAIGASQNMVGQAVHALAREEDVRRVAEAMRSTRPRPDVAVYSLAPGPAAVVVVPPAAPR